jgi:ribonucleoside-diphosphate reductase alpha chain
MSITQATLAEIVPGFPLNEPTPRMQVRKRNGSWKAVDVNKIVRAVQRCCHGLSQVDPMRVASRTIGGLYDGATTRELAGAERSTSGRNLAADRLGDS